MQRKRSSGYARRKRRNQGTLGGVVDSPTFFGQIGHLAQAAKDGRHGAKKALKAALLGRRIGAKTIKSQSTRSKR